MNRDDDIEPPHIMPNENLADAATNNACMDDPADNHASSSHHMKNSPSDEEFYGGSSAAGTDARTERPGFYQTKLCFLIVFVVVVVNCCCFTGGFGHTSDGNARASMHANDNMSENSSQPPAFVRSKSRTDMSGASSRYQNLSYWKARRLIFYRNGDPFFPGVEYRFKPGRDVSNLETLLDKISPKMDLPRGARYVFSMDGDRKYTLDELEDGASYVLSSLKVFKVSAGKLKPHTPNMHSPYSLT